jgi:hypothetical protein
MRQSSPSSSVGPGRATARSIDSPTASARSPSADGRRPVKQGDRRAARHWPRERPARCGSYPKVEKRVEARCTSEKLEAVIASGGNGSNGQACIGHRSQSRRPGTALRYRRRGVTARRRRGRGPAALRYRAQACSGGLLAGSERWRPQASPRRASLLPAHRWRPVMRPGSGGWLESSQPAQPSTSQSATSKRFKSSTRRSLSPCRI